MTTLIGPIEQEMNQIGKNLDKIIYKAFGMLMEKWKKNNGKDGFAEFYARHPRCRFDRDLLHEMAYINLHGIPEEYEEKNRNGSVKMEIYDVSKALNDSWLQEQYAIWFEGSDRFLTVCQYHLADEDKLFFNWLIRKKN
tara:strand:+ start:13986 stop:14402 length:417 start_codon:yes stop_codon:yes gene_type:complete